MTRLEILRQYKELRDNVFDIYGLDDGGQMLESLMWASLGLAGGPEEPDSDGVLRQAIEVEEAKL